MMIVKSSALTSRLLGYCSPDYGHSGAQNISTNVPEGLDFVPLASFSLHEEPLHHRFRNLVSFSFLHHMSYGGCSLDVGTHGLGSSLFSLLWSGDLCGPSFPLKMKLRLHHHADFVLTINSQLPILQSLNGCPAIETA
jgi:hypothetical protein